MIICVIVPEIWHMTDVIIFHFGLFFALFSPLTAPKYENFNKAKKNTWTYHHLTPVDQKS